MRTAWSKERETLAIVASLCFTRTQYSTQVTLWHMWHVGTQRSSPKTGVHSSIQMVLYCL